MHSGRPVRLTPGQNEVEGIQVAPVDAGEMGVPTVQVTGHEAVTAAASVTRTTQKN